MPLETVSQYLESLRRRLRNRDGRQRSPPGDRPAAGAGGPGLSTASRRSSSGCPARHSENRPVRDVGTWNVRTFKRSNAFVSQNLV